MTTCGHELIAFYENGIFVRIGVEPDGFPSLFHLSSASFSADKGDAARKYFNLVEVQIAGRNQEMHSGSKHVGTNPGNRLVYQSHADFRTPLGRKLEIVCSEGETRVTCHMQFFDGIQVIRTWTEVENIAPRPIVLDYVSSFSLTGIASCDGLPFDLKGVVHIPHNTWLGEVQWKSYRTGDLGLVPVGEFSLKRISISSTGTWSSSEHLPMGCFEDRESGQSLFWQIENNGSWQWEISDIAGRLYLKLSGPTGQENGWSRKLLPGERFTSVPAAIAFVQGGFEDCVREMTRYRRAIRRPSKDNALLPVIFNDYMNCLNADPTTEKLIPLVDAAAEAGCEYFCIDAGWYADGTWWDGVGEWLPSARRFPKGIREPLDYIRSKDMIPGLWLEIEVMGINCALASRVTDDWFFMRHGKRVISNGRYQLDFRNTEVIRHADEVVDRLVSEYGVGYIKNDYNINAGIGTETDAESFGDGLLQHNRAFLAWLDGVFLRHPGLVIENCGSGGMRMDYSLLSRCSIQSCSDQMDYRKLALIAAACPSAVTPEQCAIWSYPMMMGDAEETVFNMINALLLRIHQSGHLARIGPERFTLVKEGIEYYKRIRGRIPDSTPFWPLGLPSFRDGWVALALDTGESILLAVWRLDSQESECLVPFERLKGLPCRALCTYPVLNEETYSWSDETSNLRVVLNRNYMARVFEIHKLET